ncbi:hypothetical protein ACFLUY_00460 [Chloroflexota bacterium]
MFTIFSIPKPFRGNIGIIQRNAIQSWCRLRPACEIILFGEEEGTAAAATEFNIRYVPEVARNEYGSPLFSSLFEQAHRYATHQLMAYVNADIILMVDFAKAISQIRLDRFFMLGQRWDLDVTELLDFSNPDWESLLRSEVSKYGQLHPPSGADYYLFPQGLFGTIPPFAVGRTVMDNWLIYKARALDIPVIDATQVVTCVHQNHERTYASVGLQSPQGEKSLTSGIEASKNVELMGGKDNAFSIEYATLLLTPQVLKPALSPRHIYFRMRALPVLHPRFHFLLAPFKIFEGLVRIARSVRTS